MTDPIDCACTECQQRRCIEALRKEIVLLRRAWAKERLMRCGDDLAQSERVGCEEARAILAEPEVKP